MLDQMALFLQILTKAHYSWGKDCLIQKNPEKIGQSNVQKNKVMP